MWNVIYCTVLRILDGRRVLRVWEKQAFCGFRIEKAREKRFY